MKLMNMKENNDVDFLVARQKLLKEYEEKVAQGGTPYLSALMEDVLFGIVISQTAEK